MSNTYTPQPRPNNGTGQSGANREASLADQAKAVGQDIKSKASELTDTVTGAAKDGAVQLGNAAKDFASDTTDKVKSALNQQKTVGADYIGSIAQAATRAAMEFENIPQAAHYIRQAANQVESVADAVRTRDMRELVGEVQTFARRQPALFFGGALILGFAALRFLKSSAAPSQSTNGDFAHRPSSENLGETNTQRSGM